MGLQCPWAKTCLDFQRIFGRRRIRRTATLQVRESLLGKVRVAMFFIDCQRGERTSGKDTYQRTENICLLEKDINKLVGFGFY